MHTSKLFECSFSLSQFSFSVPGNPSEASREISIFRHIQKIILYALIAHFILKYLQMKCVFELLPVCAVEIAPNENHIEVSVNS